ncbi:Aste57867_238 [Aphanomyces stellatus]|uniref:Aste57867_238 protein n=1 Tax=Aphanomyces stellatus TaxID=120398 RepID=A0A485K799_9STRA|nr:hypothetical protein As57867_000238 [Aphanomyces stellatus]VFT77464.1 Aste57867_238 [Aphanomyces stellatus]
MGKASDAPARLNTGALVKTFWSVVNKNDVTAAALFLRRHGHAIDMDTRLASAMHATALHVATQKNNPAMATLLLAHGVHVNAQNKVGSTALHLACKQGFPEMLRILIDADADFGILDAANRAPMEYATWPILNETIVVPLELQVAALTASEMESRRTNEQLTAQVERLSQLAHQAEMDAIDAESQRLEEWMAFRAASALEDERSARLVELNRTLRQREASVHAQRTISNDVHVQLEDALMRFRTAIAQADAMKAAVDDEYELLAHTRHHKANTRWCIRFDDVHRPTSQRYTTANWASSMRYNNDPTTHTSKYVPATEQMHTRLVAQHIFPALRDAIERFPHNVKLQEYAMDAVRQICVLHPPAIEVCMQHKFVDNIQLAARRFVGDVHFLRVCVAALRAILHPAASLSGTQIKFTAKFSADRHDHLVALLVRAKSEVMPPGFVEDLVCVLFVLAKYNCRHLFLAHDCLGLDTALHFLVDTPSLNPVMARSLLGIVSLLSIPTETNHAAFPEQEPLPVCYTTFGLAKVTPLIETYAANPDIVLWGIRLLRNLADRDAVAKDQVNRSGIEHILARLMIHRDAPALRVSILQLLYVAFTTNYTRLQQVDELSTRVLDCATQCLVDHADSPQVQEMALKNLVVAAQHDSNADYLMTTSQDAIETCLLQLLTCQVALTTPGPLATEITFWTLRLVLVVYNYERVRRADLPTRAATTGLAAMLHALRTYDDRVKNVVVVLQQMITHDDDRQ